MTLKQKFEQYLEDKQTHPCNWPYTSFLYVGGVTLDGHFSIDDLKMLVKLMEEEEECVE